MLILSETERKLVDVLSRGEPAMLGAEDAGDREIRAEVLRAMAFGLKVTPREGEPPIELTLPATGLVLRGARVKGVLDLSGAGGDGARGQMALDLEGCELLGDPALGAYGRANPALKCDGARLSRVTLIDCAFAKVSLANTHVAGDVLVQRARPLSEGGECSLLLRAARIGGAIRVSDSTFRLPKRRSQHPDGFHDYAIDVASVHVGGDVQLQPRVTAHGGVRLTGATIAGDARACGLHAFAEDDEALDLQLVRIGGALLLRDWSKERGLELVGSVNLLSAQIGSWLQFQFSRFDPTADDTPVELNASLVTIGGEAVIGGVRRDNVGPKFRGRVLLNGATVRGALSLGEWDAADQIRPGPLVLTQCSVGRDVQIGAGQSVIGDVFASELKVGGDLVASGVMQSCSLKAGRVEGDLLLSATLRVQGAVDLSFAKVGRLVTLAPGGRIENERKGIALKAEQGCFGGVNLAGACSGSLDFTLCTIDGDFCLGGFSENGLPLPLTFQTAKDDKRARLKLVDAEVRGVLEVHAMEFEREAEGSKFQTGQPLRPSDGPATARADFVRPFVARSGPARCTPLKTRSIPLACYPGWRLVEAKRQADADGFDFYLLGPRNQVVPLDGTSPPIHAFNQEHNLPKLDTDEQALSYLRFFCGCIWGEEGAFRIVDDPAMLAGLKPKQGQMRSPKIEITARAADHIDADVTLQYAEYLFAAKMRVQPSGMVEMVEDDPICELDLGEQVVLHQRPYRLFKGGWPPPLTSGQWRENGPELLAERKAIRADRRRAQRFRRQDAVGELDLIDLSNSTVGMLRDSFGRAWGDSVHLKLNDFRYGAIEVPESYAEQARTPTRTKGDPLDALKELAAQRPSSWGPEDFELASAMLEERSRPGGGAEPGLARALIRLAENPALSQSRSRIRWLRLMSANRKFTEDFPTQPFEQLITALRRAGQYSAAPEIVAFRARSEAHHRCAQARGPLQWAAAWAGRGFGLLYRVGFGHGLRPERALLTTAAYWLAGAIGATYLAWGDVWAPFGDKGLLLQAGWIQEGRPPSLEVAPDETAEKQPRACRDEIRGGIYAADAMIPFVDLGEETRCRIRKEAWAAKWAKAIYSLLGALVLSLTIFTVTNSARRYVER